MPFSICVMAQSGSSINTNTGVHILKSLEIAKTSDMHFGTMSIPTAPVDVVLTISNTRSASSPADIDLLAQAPFSKNAAYTIAGSPNATYSIILPPNGMVMLHSGGNNMNVNSFSCSYPGLTGVLSAAGTDQFNVGATLELKDAQPYGIYEGTFDVTIAYN